MAYWKGFVAGADAMVLADGLLVVGTPAGLVAFDAFTGDQRWVVEDIEGAAGTWFEPRGANLAYWADHETVLVDLRDGVVITELDEPQPSGAPDFQATVNGFEISSDFDKCRVVSPLGKTWVVHVPEPFYAEGMIITEGAWAWFAVSDGRLFGVDFAAPTIENDLDDIVHGPPVHQARLEWEEGQSPDEGDPPGTRSLRLFSRPTGDGQGEGPSVTYKLPPATGVELVWGHGYGRGLLALVGSGEYLPEMAAVEGSLLQGRPRRYVQLATAAVPDGPAVVEHWHQLGREQAERLAAEAVVLPVNDRADADDPQLAARVAGAGLVYLSGGHPAYLARTLGGTAVWAAIVEAWKRGASLAGCSAGAMAFAAWVPSIYNPGEPAVPGLGLLPQLRVVPHFDRLSRRGQAAVERFVLAEDVGVMVLGVDEETALVGGPEHWHVEGRGSVWLLSPEGNQQFPAGSPVVTPRPVARQ